MSMAGSGDEHGGGGKKSDGGKQRVVMFGEYDYQINIVCYPSEINK